MKISSSSKIITLFGIGLLTTAGAAGGCEDWTELVIDPGGTGGELGGSGGGGAGVGGKPSSSDGGLFDIPDGGANDAMLTEDTACVATVAEATLTRRPVDIIFVIDNSPSMSDEIISVQRNINDSFAALIEASGVDYRVIMLAEHGDALAEDSVCIGAPLSGTTCAPLPPAPVNNPPRFFHYSYPNESHNSLCNILGTYNNNNNVQPDQYGLAPNGWSEWVRPDSLKVFVEITDDNVACQSTHLPRGNNVYVVDRDTPEGGESVAAWFDAALFAMQPAVFGDALDRNYIFHSIVGLGENSPATEAWGPTEPMVLGTCGTAVAFGTGYQALSQATGGLRFPLCEFSSYDVVFQAIAEGVITGSVVTCDYRVPDPPPGETLDLSTVVVQYTPGDMSTQQYFNQVADASACMSSNSFYIQDDTILLCPSACEKVQADPMAKVDTLYGCAPPIPN